MKMEVMGLPETPGPGYRWANIIRCVEFGEEFYCPGEKGVISWRDECKSVYPYPIVERIEPKKMILEQVLDPAAVCSEDIVFVGDVIPRAVGYPVADKYRKCAEEGRVWRRVRAK